MIPKEVPIVEDPYEIFGLFDNAADITFEVYTGDRNDEGKKEG